MPKKVLLFLCQGFEALEAAVFTDVFGWTREEGIEKIELETVGLRTEVQCTWNFLVKPEKMLSDIQVDDYDALAIPGGFGEAGFYEDAFDERFLDLIRTFDQKGKMIASVCVGSVPVGKSGVLKNRKATTYDLRDDKRREQLASYGAKVLDDRIIVDKNIISSTGPATAMDVAFLLLEKLSCRANAKIIRHVMRFPKGKNG